MIYEVNEIVKKIDNQTIRLSRKFNKVMGRPAYMKVLFLSDDAPSEIYVRNKRLKGQKMGIDIDVMTKKYRSNYIHHLIDLYNKDRNIDAIMIQSPVGPGYNEESLMSDIKNNKDADGLTDKSICNPCTAEGVLRLLKYKYENNLENMNVVIIGRSKLVGKPLHKLLVKENCNVTILHSHTSRQNMLKYFDIADIIVSAVGKDDFTITKDMFKPDKEVFIADVGIKRINGKIMGDCDKSLYDDDKITITRTPKGTAQLTLSVLMHNIIKCAYINHTSSLKLPKTFEIQK